MLLTLSMSLLHHEVQEEQNNPALCTQLNPIKWERKNPWFSIHQFRLNFQSLPTALWASSALSLLAKTPTYTCWWQTALDPFGSTPWANISSCPRDQAELRSHQSRGENLPLLAQHLCFIHQEGLFGGIIDFSPEALWTRWYFEIPSKLVCSRIRQILISIYFSLRWEEPKHRPLHLWHWDSHTWSNGSSN